MMSARIHLIIFSILYASTQKLKNKISILLF
jgi:hypothetical protein